MPAKSFLYVLVVLLAGAAPKRTWADPPAHTGGSASVISGANLWAERSTQTRESDPEGGPHEPANLFLLGAGFVTLGIAVAAASRRRDAEPDQTPAWTSVTVEE